MFKRSKAQEKKGSEKREVLLVSFLKVARFVFAIILRLKNLELGYSCPKKWLQGFVISNARVFVRGTNLLTFSRFNLWDPELATGDGAKYPAMKSVSVGFDITF